MVTHQVRRANFRLKMTRAPDAAQQEHWQREFERRYLALLDQALERWLQRRPQLASRVVEVPRLQLDLGTLDTVDDEVLVRSLQQQLDASMPNVSDLDPELWRLQCYLHFLQRGTWPLGSPLHSVSAAETWLLAQTETTPALLKRLRSGLEQTVVWQRLLNQHTAQFLGWLAAHAPLHLPGEINAALDELRDHHKFSAVLSLYLSLWWQHGRTLYYQQPHVQPALLDTLRSVRLSTPDATLLNQVIRRIDELETPPHEMKREPRDEHPDRRDPRIDDEQLEHGVLVQQAGIVLLHPFLPRLFNTLGLLDSSGFRNEQARLQAIFTLHYIVTGRQYADESELALHKFLVQWRVDHPVPVSLTLDPRLYSEIDHMVRTVIDEWRVLKNTSIDGLRETFLQRTGSLQKLDEGYRLAVTGRSVDILLAQLPWSLNVVMLPWFTQPLFIHWGKP